MKILITGGLGFIGSNLAKFFAPHHKITIFDNLKRDRIERNLSGLNHPSIDIVRGDVRLAYDFQDLGRHDFVLHFAGNAGIPWSLQNPESDFYENVVGTFNVLQYAHRYDAAVIMASTNRVYPLTTGYPLEETEFSYRPQDPAMRDGINETYNMNGFKSPYGASKAAADMLCQEWYHSFGVRTIVNRMGVIYGEGQWGATEQGWLGYFCRMKELNEPITIYGNGKQVRDPLYITDLCNLIQAQMESVDEAAGGVYNVGGGRFTAASLLEVINYLKIENVSFEPERVADMKWYITDGKLAHETFDWTPMVDLYFGIDKTIHWLRNEKNID
jgi:CDP-paratose 2-epimerase